MEIYFKNETVLDLSLSSAWCCVAKVEKRFCATIQTLFNNQIIMVCQIKIYLPKAVLYFYPGKKIK